jgi:Glycosyl transferase family 2
VAQREACDKFGCNRLYSSRYHNNDMQFLYSGSPPPLKCAILCAVKNEAAYIFEHYAWYKRLGFSRFIYFHNDCTDQTVEVLATLAAYDPQVTAMDNVLEPGDRPQMSAYEQAHARILPQLQDWYILVVDIDEFLLLKQHESIQDLIEAFSHPEVISFNWRIFGSNGHSEYADDLVVNRFTACAPDAHPLNRPFKSIWRNTAQVVSNGPHRPHFRSPTAIRWVYPTIPPLGQDMPPAFRKGSDPRKTDHSPCLDTAQINHYIVKSRSEFAQKIVRGRGWIARGKSQGTRHTSAFFIEYDRNEVIDNQAASSAPEIVKEINLLRQKFVEMHGCDLAFSRLGLSGQHSAAPGAGEPAGSST